jgi:hypothetical protein
VQQERSARSQRRANGKRHEPQAQQKTKKLVLVFVVLAA